MIDVWINQTEVLLSEEVSLRRDRRMTGNDVTDVWIDQVEVIAVAIHRIKHHLKVARV